MTTETSNARGWVLVPRELTPEMREAWERAPASLEAEWAALLAAAPPSDAARGGVRGLVAKLAAHVRPTCSELWDEAQAFLAAEGVQAGECCVPDAGEPSFVLLGRDPQAPALIEAWAADRERAEPDSDKPAKARAVATAMREYKVAHPDKGLPSAALSPRGGGEVVGYIVHSGAEVSRFEATQAAMFLGLGKHAVYTAPPSAPVGLDPPVEQQRDMLAQAIRDAAVKAGIARADADMTGPMLLMLCDDMADCILAQQPAAVPVSELLALAENMRNIALPRGLALVDTAHEAFRICADRITALATQHQEPTT